MKPSEAFDYLNDLHSASLGAKLRWVALQASYEGLRKQLDDGVAIDIVGESAKNLLAESASERDEEGSEEGPAPSAESAAAPRKPRSDIGKSRGPRATKAQSNEGRMREGELPEMAVRLPVDQEKSSAEMVGARRATKAHVAPVTSPLTAELRAKLEATLAGGPLKLSEIEAMSWTVGLDVDGLLCEDTSAFVCWTPRGAKSARWGTAAQFDRDVRALSIPMIEDAAQYTARALEVPLGVAVDAWKRIDKPEAT